MAQKTLKDALIDELRDMYDAERQLTRALPKMAKAATAAELKEAFSSHLEQTQGQIVRLQKVFGMLGQRARGKHCAGIAGIIEEGASIMEEDFDETAMDASLVAAGQRTEHYEIAAYGNLVAWARELGHMEVGELLQETLNEEKSADELLSALANARVNQDSAVIPLDDEPASELVSHREPARLWSRPAPRATASNRMTTVIAETGPRRRAGR
jgi:ferritin-like metal-binding protein YciE